jgi:hypothetical protein
MNRQVELRPVSPPSGNKMGQKRIIKYYIALLTALRGDILI